MQNYRKFIVAIVGAVLIGLDQFFNISLQWGAEDIVTTLIALLTAIGVERVPNAPAAPTTGA